MKLTNFFQIFPLKVDVVGKRVSGFAIAMTIKLGALFLVEDLPASLKVLIVEWVSVEMWWQRLMSFTTRICVYSFTWMRSLWKLYFTRPKNWLTLITQGKQIWNSPQTQFKVSSWYLTCHSPGLSWNIIPFALYRTKFRFRSGVVNWELKWTTTNQNERYIVKIRKT